MLVLCVLLVWEPVVQCVRAVMLPNVLALVLTAVVHHRDVEWRLVVTIMRVVEQVVYAWVNNVRCWV